MRDFDNRYIYGSEAPVKQPAYEPRKEKSQITRSTVRREAALGLDLPFLIILTAALAVAIALCCSYLKIQSSINVRIKNIESYESRLEKLKNENDALETRINTSVDLDEIYRIATEEMGMVYANKNQVIRYKKTESEYVIQNENIPGE